MGSSVYIASVEGSTGKSTVALGVLQQLSRRVERVAVFRPIVRPDTAMHGGRDYVLDLLTAHEAVQTAYGFHLCGVAEPNRPWDWAVKLVGPVVVSMATDPPTVQVAEATNEVSFTDRVGQLFPERYQQEARQESLGEQRMTELRERYDQAAGL